MSDAGSHDLILDPHFDGMRWSCSCGHIGYWCRSEQEVMESHGIHVRRATEHVRKISVDLSCDSIACDRYYWECTCGMRGRSCGTFDEARRGHINHVLKESR